MKNTPYPYQATLLTQIESLRLSSPLPIVLAASCGSGKTFMSINFIESFLKQVPTAKVLVLAHGQTILRSQYHANLLDQKPAFTFKEITKGKQLDKYYSKKQVFVTLPQTLQKVEIPHFDLVVVDEAHQRYFAKQVEEIIKAAAPAHQLLLTGTPSPFIARNTPTKVEFNILTLPMADLLAYGSITDVLVELASTTYPISGEDYNTEGNLKEDFKFEDLDTVTTLDKLLDKIHKRLKSVIKNNPTLYSAMPTISGWLSVLSSLEKTMFACHSQEQARQVAAYFNSKGVNTALSTSDDDLEAEEVDRFVNEKDCQVLIVVGRGVLGFNFEALVNVVDMTGSQNIDRIFQLMARVVRKHPKGYKKLFFKIVPKTMASYFEHLMTGVLCLTCAEWYSKYNGNNFLNLPLPVKKMNRVSDIRDNGKKRTGPKQKPKPVEYIGLPAISLFNDITHKDNSQFNSYEWTTLGKVREKLLDIKNQDPLGRAKEVIKYWKKTGKVQYYTPNGQFLRSYRQGSITSLSEEIKNELNKIPNLANKMEKKALEVIREFKETGKKPLQSTPNGAFLNNTRRNGYQNLSDDTKKELAKIPKGHPLGRDGLPRGVHKKGKGFQAIIGISNKSMSLGTFDTQQEAHEAYNQACKKYGREITCECHKA